MHKSNNLIIGSTGNLGKKLLNFCHKFNISIFGISCFKSLKKLNYQSHKYGIKNCFNLYNPVSKDSFISFISNNKFKIVYFLDYGSFSLYYLNILNKKNKNCIFAIANKEMIIAGGNLLSSNILNQSNFLLPLDSEHFSLYNSKFCNSNIDKIYITASGGPFYFNKNVNLNNVKYKEVLNHPKWKMGINNSIDSSNFINKVLEMHELSFLYNIDMEKIDFLVSQEAFVHSIILHKDQNISLNCFDNDMMITLSKPLTLIFNLNIKNKFSKKIFDQNNFKFEIFKDKRFIINKYISYFKKLDHYQLIQFMLLNNKAHEKYLKGDIEYNDIINFIIKNLSSSKEKINFSSFKDILRYISSLKSSYDQKF